MTKRQNAQQTVDTKANSFPQRRSEPPRWRGRPGSTREMLHRVTLGRQHLGASGQDGGMVGWEHQPWPAPFPSGPGQPAYGCWAACLGSRASLQGGAQPPLPAPKLHLEILHPALLVEKEKEELRKRERRGGDSILFLNNKQDFSDKLIGFFLSSLKVTGWKCL